MSDWTPQRYKNVDGDQTETVTNIPPKTNIDTTMKLQVIQALDNGQCKADIAREYGVDPRTIANIYKQKASIIKKYTQKYKLLQQVCSLNLEQNLLNWFEQQIKLSNIITEDQLRNKAIDILKPSEEFTCDDIDDWLYSFRMRHNITKYAAEDGCEAKSTVEWKKFMKSSETKEIYIGGVCALSYSLDIGGYLNGQNSDSYVSILLIVNTLGTVKKEAAVVGKELLESEANVKSLPVNYYYCVDSQVNYSVIISYLTKWNNELSAIGKFVTLVLNIPDSMLRSLQFKNIKIVSTTDLEYTKIILEKIIECFKYNYRRAQISRSITYGKDNCTFLDHIYMIGTAWYNVPQKYIQSMSMPPEEGSLHFDTRDDGENDHSISRWCKMFNVPLNIDNCTSSIDKYIFCDTELPCICNGQLENSMQAIEVLNQKACQSTSGMEAYQAMKRLLTYLQGESAGASIIKYAKYLENHMEYGALLHMHHIRGSADDST